MTSNSDAVRAAPLVAGGASVVALLLNRVLSGVAPVADAGSSQSRADVLCLAMAGCLILTDHLIALKPKPRPRSDSKAPTWRLCTPTCRRTRVRNFNGVGTRSALHGVRLRGGFLPRETRHAVRCRAETIGGPAILATDVPDLGPICRR